MKSPRPLHSRFAIAGWTCLGFFAALLITDEICKRTSLPRVEQWPFFGTPLTLLPLPLLAGTIICGGVSVALRRHHRLSRAWHACPQCEYDRIGLGLDAPCPECGHAPSTPASPI